MIKQKAPKDMTVGEFLAFAKDRYHATFPDDPVMTAGFMFGLLEDYASIPAPNPFTPDQLAWMRVEQRSGYNYAAIDFDGEVRLFQKKPMKDCTHWNKITGSNAKSNGKGSWLSKLLSIDDPDPLCFADYAPLEEKK